MRQADEDSAEDDREVETPSGWADRNVWPRVGTLARSRVAQRFLPGSIRQGLFTAGGLREIRALDRKINEEGRIPDDEEVTIESVWVSECYPPSYLDGLVSGLEALHVGRQFGADESAADIVRRYRSGAYAGGTANLGLFTRASRSGFGDYVHTDLPAIVTRASGWLENVTPSLTTITIQFEMTDDAGKALQHALRADYRTKAKKRRNGWLYADPDNQRREAMQKALDDLNIECSGWLRRHFPGAFAGGLLGVDYPSCAFLTTKQCVPLARTKNLVKWLWVAELDAAHETWDSADWPGLHLRVPDGDRGRHHWLLAGRRGDFLSDPDDQLQRSYGGVTRGGWLNRINNEMSLTLMLHATDSLVLGMHEAVARSRDTMGAKTTRKWNLQRLDALRADVTSFVRDVEPVASELGNPEWRTTERATFRPGANHIRSLIRESDLKRAHEKATSEARDSISSAIGGKRRRSKTTSVIAVVDPDPLPTLTKQQADTIRYRANDLLAAERQHRDALATVSTLVAAGESVRLDRWVFVLTLVLGAVAVIAALPQIAAIVSAVLRQLGLD